MVWSSKALPGLLAALMFPAVSCRRDPPVPVPPPHPSTVLKLTVEPLWNGAAFNKELVYSAAGSQRVKVTLVKFFLSPLDLAGDSAAASLIDADLFDVTNGPQVRLYTVPTGFYNSLNLGLGLPPALNHRDIATIPPNAPTGNNSGMYWSWATLYRFMLFEGKFDSIPGGQGEPPFNFSIHTGLDTCYRTRSFPVQLVASEADTARLTITVDIARFFSDGTQVLQLSQGAMWHGEVDELGIGLKAADLQAAALGTQ